MPRDRRPGRRLRNPLVVMPLVAALLTVGWVQYSDRGPEMAQPRPGADLWPVDRSVTSHAVAGWRLDSSGDAVASVSAVPGPVTDRAAQVVVGAHRSGDITLTGPRIAVEPGESHLFKAHTSSDTPVGLLVRLYRPDGTDELVEVPDEQGRQGTWATVAHAFDSGDTTVAVQYVFRLAAVGTFAVDGAYLEAADDVVVAPSPAPGPDLLPNHDLVASVPGQPDSWTPYSSGALSVRTGWVRDADGGRLLTEITDYRDGEAKWQYPPVPVEADRSYRFTAGYRSDQPVDVVAEFELADGGRRFVNLSTVPPAGEWTTVSDSFQAPAGARTVLVTLVSHGVGTTQVRRHSLVDTTRPGPVRWSRPLVSVTVDDGWRSAAELVRPLLDQRGLAATFYVNPATIGTPGFLSAAQLTSLHRGGHEVASHAHADVDLTGLRAERVEELLRTARQELAAAGLATDDLAVPFGRSDPQVEWYARQQHLTVRGTDAGINTRQDLDPDDLEVLVVDGTTTPGAVSDALAATARMHGWLVLVYTQVSAGAPGTTHRGTVPVDALAAQLDLVAGSGITVSPVSAAFAEVAAQ